MKHLTIGILACSACLTAVSSCKDHEVNEDRFPVINETIRNDSIQKIRIPEKGRPEKTGPSLFSSDRDTRYHNGIHLTLNAKIIASSKVSPGRRTVVG